MNIIKLRDHPMNRDLSARLIRVSLRGNVYQTDTGYIATLPGGRCFDERFPTPQAAQDAIEAQT